MQIIREKVAMRGYASLSEEELLTLLLEDNALAQTLLAECGSLKEIAKLPTSRLRMTAGLGSKKAEKIHIATDGEDVVTVPGGGQNWFGRLWKAITNTFK